MIQREEGSPPGRWHSPLRLLLLGGVIAPILFVLVFTVLGAIRPGYSPLSQMISDLGAVGDNAWIQNTNFIVSGSLLVAFAIGFYQAMGQIMKRRPLLVSSLLLGVTGTGLICAGIFTEDPPRSAVVSLHGILHIVSFLVLFVSLITALFIIGGQLRKIPSWRSYGWYTTITASASLILVILVGPIPSHGLINRLLVVTAFAWYVVIGYRLLVSARA
jgi:hypothetical membrane protein